jgi:hypothetical protein
MAKFLTEVHRQGRVIEAWALMMSQVINLHGR